MGWAHIISLNRRMILARRLSAELSLLIIILTPQMHQASPLGEA